MDKQTLSNYGWIVAVILILSIMIALATPFATAVKNSVVGTTNNFTDRLNNALADSWENSTGSDDDSGDTGDQGGNGGEANDPEEPEEPEVPNEDEITDLTGTTWYVPAGWTATAGYRQFSVNGILHNVNGEEPYYSELSMMYIGYGFNNWEAVAKINSIWLNAYPTIPTSSDSFTITIIGGPDTLNTALISWLKENGELKSVENSGNGGGVQLPAGGEVSEAGEILDSWEVIINNVNNGTYSTKYAVGNYKPLDLGSEGIVNMQIAAIDADVMSDGSGNAHITWIAKELLATKKPMNSSATNAGGWEASAMRAYLQNDIWALINPTVQNAIVEVKKTYYDYATNSTKTCSYKVWIPSYREVGFGTDYEDDGAIYSELFTNNSSRIKKLNGSSTYWWLRSANSSYSTGFRSVGNNGYSSNYDAISARGVALSFCF